MAQAPRPKLVLDSGASIHVVGDRRLLCNLRDAPAGKRITVGNGSTLPVTKIGDIEMADAGFRIPGVYHAPGVKFDVISVRELSRQSGICTWFDGDRAMLYAGRQLVGAAREKYGHYILESLSMSKSHLDGEMRSVTVTARTGFGSVLCWLKALLCERLCGSGPEEKPMWKPHGSDGIRRERRRKKRKKSGRRR